jgi:hypothetical protein
LGLIDCHVPKDSYPIRTGALIGTDLVAALGILDDFGYVRASSHHPTAPCIQDGGYSRDGRVFSFESGSCTAASQATRLSWTAKRFNVMGITKR